MEVFWQYIFLVTFHSQSSIIFSGLDLDEVLFFAFLANAILLRNATSVGFVYGFNFVHFSKGQFKYLGLKVKNFENSKIWVVAIEQLQLHSFCSGYAIIWIYAIWLVGTI